MNPFASKMSSTAEYEMLRMEDDPVIAPNCRLEHQVERIESDTKEVSTQEWANGLRGLAAFSVMNHHLIACFNPQATWKSCDEDGTIHIWQWPIVRVATSPNFMVTTFFVLSGYVLSYGPLDRLDKNPTSVISVRNSLASACLRRIFRLLPPAAMSIVISHIILLLGGFNLARNGTKWEFWITDGAPRWVTNTWYAQTIEALRSIVIIWYQRTTPSHYNVVLWTMPQELQGSLNIYLFLLATSKLRRRFRTMLAIGLAILQLVTKETLTLEFILGLLIAELQVVRFKPLQSKKSIQAWHWIQIFLRPIALVMALMCGSIPAPIHNKADPVSWARQMYEILYKLYSQNPEEVESLYQVTGVSLMILTISQWTEFKQMLSVRPLRYLGKISFSLYVLHAPLLVSLGVWLVVQFRQLGISDPSSVFLMVPFWYGSVLGSSHLMTTFIDQKAIQLSHQLEKVWGVKSTSDSIQQIEIPHQTSDSTVAGFP